MLHGKKYQVILLFPLLLLSGKIEAQNQSSYLEIDSMSYRLYVEQSWTLLSRLCKQAIRSGTDYYYLRMRAGIANFKEQKYREAIGHFKKAMEYNNGDEVALEYLYYCYVYSGRIEQARWLSKSFNREMSEQLKTDKQLPFDLIQLETGTKRSDSANLFKNPQYVQLGFNHYVANRISVFHAVNYYAQKESRFHLKQVEYYLNPSIPFRHDLRLSLGAHLLNTTSHFARYTVTEPVAPATSTVYTHDTVEAKLTQVVLSGMLTKHYPLFDFHLGATANYQYSGNHYQLNAGVSIYPFKNNRLVIGSVYCLHSDDYFTSYSSSNSPFVTVYLNERVSVTAAYFTNNGANLSELNGYLVNNSFDATSSRWVMVPSVSLNRKTHLYCVLGYETKTEKINLFKYHYSIFLLGIKFTPF